MSTQEEVKRYSDIIGNIKKTISQMSKSEKNNLEHSENNIFHILGLQDFEIRHSNFLAWLFEKNTEFLKGFLLDTNICNIPKEKVAKLISSPKEVKREYPLNGRSLDILIDFKDEKTIIAIENKWYASEEKTQLADYYHSIENLPQFKDYEKVYIFLTLNGIKPANDEDKKHYISIGYNHILKLLESTKVKNIFINHYIEILKEKTVRVMDRVKEYYNLYSENKEIMVEMAEYTPNIKKRAELEKTILQNTEDVEIESQGQNTFIWFFNNTLKDLCLKNNMPKNWLSFCLCNEPYNKLEIQFVIDHDDNKRYIEFSQKFREAFKREDRSKNSTYSVLLTQTLVVSNNNSGYLTEEQFQGKIREELSNYFSNPDSTYFKIINFVKNYKF